MHGSNARNLSVYLSLSQLAKMLCLSYYCLCLLFNKKRAEQVLPGSKEGGGRGRERGTEGERTQTIYADMNI
jgi:hypothetical protein